MSRHAVAPFGGSRGSQKTVQFIHRTVRFNARAVFRDALAADESRFAAIALAGVDAIDGESGLVKRFFHCDLAVVHFIPATKLSFGDGKPNTSSYWRLSALRRFAYAVTP